MDDQDGELLGWATTWRMLCPTTYLLERRFTHSLIVVCTMSHTSFSRRQVLASLATLIPKPPNCFGLMLIKEKIIKIYFYGLILKKWSENQPASSVFFIGLWFCFGSTWIWILLLETLSFQHLFIYLFKIHSHWMRV